ncbi:hypothetical protein GGP70_002784 [Salinibacter ruber]|nr:hypothetical protein [Salinibacter ruber]
MRRVPRSHHHAEADTKAWEEERDVLFHGQELPATDTTAGLVTEDWILDNYAQAEGVTDLDKVLKRGTGGCARDVAICSPDWERGVTIDEAPGAPLPGFAAAAERARRPASGPGGLGTVPPKAAQIVVPAAGRSQNAYRRCVPARRRPTDGPERAGIATLRQKCSAGGPIALGPENRSGSEFTCSLARTGGLNELARARQWAETRHRPRPSVRPCRRPLPRARQGRGAPSSTGHPAGEDCANRCPR